MILADKIITLRKKNGWSQEELAEKLNVTRQSVSKWEGAQSIPDLEKILKMSEIFGVSTDYLLKDEYEEVEYAKEESEPQKARRVSMEEANEFLAVKKWSAMKIAIATFLCIISPACLLMMSAALETNRIALSENAVCGIGLIVLLLMVTVAVVIFISCGNRTKPYEYFEKELIETEYGVSGMVKERQKQFRDTYNRFNIIGTCLCILSAIPIIVVSFNEDGIVMVFAVPLTLLIVGIGVICFIKVGIPWSSMEKLLQEGDYTLEKKLNNKRNETISAVYWLVATAIYLAYSFITGDWEISWIIWPVAGVLYAAVIVVCNVIRKKDSQ